MPSARGASKVTKARPGAPAIDDKHRSPAQLHSKKHNVFESPSRRRFSNQRKTKDIARVHRHTRNRVMDGLPIENEQNRG